MQTALERNLTETLDMTFLATEYVTDFGSRIGTLAMDAYGAPVIIMYKSINTDNIIGQSISNAKWLQTQKPEFFNGLQESTLEEPTPKSFHLNWDALRIVCVAEAFSRLDRDTASALTRPIELFRLTLDVDNTFTLEQLPTERAN